MRIPFILLSLLCPMLAWTSPAEEPKSDIIPILESTQDFLGGSANNVANRLDLFFADQRADDELARSRLRIRQRYVVREDSLPKEETQIRFNIKLPKLEEKFKFEWGKKKEKKEPMSSSETAKQSISQKDLEKQWQFRSNVGFNASIPPKMSFQNRLRKNMETGDVIHRFVKEVVWFSDRDWESNTAIDSDLALSEDLLLRFRNFAEWKITRHDFLTGHGPALIQRLTDNDGLSHNFTVTTIVDPSWFVSNYQLSTTYRRNLYRQWLYLDVQPGLDFPRLLNWRRSPFIFFQLEVLFGR